MMDIYSQEGLSEALTAFPSKAISRNWLVFGSERIRDEFTVSGALQFACYLREAGKWETFSIKVQ